MKIRLLIMVILYMMTGTLYAQKESNTICDTVTLQTKKGSFLAGGSVLYNKETTLAKTFNFSPKVGYFIADNLAIGLGLNYKSDKQWGIGSARQTPQQDIGYGLSAFGRYYIDIINGLKFFGELKLNGTTGKVKRINDEGNTDLNLYKYNQYTAGLAPGFAFFPGSRLSIDLSLILIGYQHRTIRDANIKVYDSSDFRFGLDTITPEIGINFHF